MKLRPVIYEMKTENIHLWIWKGTQIDLLLKKWNIFPSLVVSGAHPGENENDPFIEYKGINYIGLTPILVKAIQEQQNIIEEQNEKIESLKKEINSINERLKKLENNN